MGEEQRETYQFRVEQVIFSVEKKFNLNSPDRLAYYWNDAMREGKVQMSRRKGGGSEMVWGAFSGKVRSELMVMRSMQGAKRYIMILEDSLLDFISTHDDSVVFQQENASIYTARMTSNWFVENNITMMDWPAPLSRL